MNLVREKRPFQIDAFVLLPDHLHCIWTLPQGDSDYPTRWRRIKERFTRSWLAAGHNEGVISNARKEKGSRGVWQERFWEHMIRDERDFEAHVEYILYNPVKHGHVRCPHQWPHSSFHRLVRQGVYAGSWGCQCEGPRDVEFAFEMRGIRAGE